MPDPTARRHTDDQALSNREQRLSNSDQKLSDADQRCSDSDQARADRDQLASDRDQAASDRALLFGGSAHAHALSRDDRRRATLMRQRAARARLNTGGWRDARACARTLVALTRDQTADRRTTSGPDRPAS